ncbi:unnamed protein product [Xylocopa violacea]|uniref:Trichohyalin-plectin-homology domain-containing protein n=1 Tax=Xylocopa violacea TaxID=135666 RepID=A0ABP1N2F5_XYLVO
MCRRINQGFLLSECLRELDAQLKFRETLKNIDKEQEIAQVNLMKDDVAKYQKEMKQKAEEQLEKRRNYAIELKRQIEENKNTLLIKNKEEFEAEKQDQINMTQCLQDMKEYEAQQLQNKKERLKKFFNDAIEEKKQFDLKLKDEEEFENRANEIYRNAKLQIQKIHKAVVQKEREEKEKKAELISEKFRTFLKSKKEVEERILKKAQEEQEEQYKEEQRMKQEREIQIRKELQNFQMEAMAKKAKQLQEERELKTWEIMQRFKKAECDKDREAEERKQQWNKKIEYAKSLKKYISEKEAEREQEKLAEDEAINMNKIIEIENKKILDYAEEVINESKGVRPLYPILKAVEECKKEMGLIPPKKREEVISTEPKRRRKIRRCTKVVPEDKICYL